MSGVVTVVLSEDEVDRLIEWGDWYSVEDAPPPLLEQDIALFRKLQGYRQALACPVPRAFPTSTTKSTGVKR